jgi:hypothetical protein
MPAITDKYAKREYRRALRARDFPVNTCPASRHVQMIGEFLARRKRYPMIEEEPEHVAGSLLSTVASLYQCRTKLKKLKAQVARLKSRNSR